MAYTANNTDPDQTAPSGSSLIRVLSVCFRVHLNNEPQHEVSNNVVCVTSKASDQPAHMRSLIRAFASRLNII